MMGGNRKYAVIMVIGFIIMMVGMDIFEGALKLIMGIVC